MPPRLSLWLLSRASDEVTNKLSTIISSKIPSLFPDTKLPSFPPHLTLATDIDASLFSSRSPQAWLESLDLAGIDTQDMKVAFTGVETGNTFTKKCYLQSRRTMPIEKLAKQLHVQIFGSSEEEAIQWVREQWDPHLSLL
jgi:hypothetical protein